MLNKAKTESVHISKIRVGDVVNHKGEFKTVTRSNLGSNTFLGDTLFGDSFKGGKELVTRIITNPNGTVVYE